VNDLENVLYAVLDHRLQKRGREGLSLRLLIRGLLGYMRAKETDILDVGCRTLAVAMGKHHVTIARLLPILVQASDGILTKIGDARQKAADVYLIQLPEHYQQLARELTWRKGRIHAIRPVFRALGDVAALAYEAIERGRHSPTTAEVARNSGVSRNACSAALVEMEALGMIQRHGGTWKTTSTNLRMLAARLGVLDDYLDHIRRNRHERAIWHAYLDRFKTLQLAIAEVDLFDPERDEYWLPPDDAAVWRIDQPA
jgi:predicted HD phosphohydrolase